MNGQTITIPVEATMRKQPDGSWKMVEANYVTVDASLVAAFIARKFGLSVNPAHVDDEMLDGRR